MASTLPPYYQQLPSLSPEQRNLLRAALSSNKNNSPATSASGQPANGVMQSRSIPSETVPSAAAGINPSVLESFDNAVRPLIGDGPRPTFGDGLFPDYEETGTSFDVDRPSFDDDLSSKFPDLPLDALLDGDFEFGEKRKSPSDDEDGDQQDEPKRRESEEKVSKKPGRKPITSEPTTKRKAQNRAAQRAFRERKEQHLKDLEQKVEDYQKASDAANHENGLLKAQVVRLQAELREYRRRLSSSANGGNSPPRNALPSGQIFPNTANKSSDFSFDFPKFGGLVSSNFPSNGSYAGSTDGSMSQQSPSASKSVSQSPGGEGMSPQYQVAKSQSQSSSASKAARPANGSSTNFNGGFFGSSFFDTLDSNSFGWPSATSPQTTNSAENTSPVTNNNFFSASSLLDARNGSTSSNTGSPSGSSGSHQVGPSSSCGTSPEPSHNSPPTKKIDSLISSNDNVNDFANFASPAASELSSKAPNTDFSGIDWLAAQNGGQFDPVLFGGYRDSQNAVIGGGEFTGGLWDDFNLPEFDNNNVNETFNFNLATDNTIPAPAPAAKLNLMQQVEAQKDGDYSGGGGAQPDAVKFPDAEARAMYTCHAVWNKLQNCPKFAAGDFDIDGLCKELSTKAKCSETGKGVQFPRDDVEAAIKRLVGDEAYDSHEAGRALDALTSQTF